MEHTALSDAEPAVWHEDWD